MELIDKSEKPLKPIIVDFLKSQHCDFQNGYPKVCCGKLPKKLQEYVKQLKDPIKKNTGGKSTTTTTTTATTSTSEPCIPKMSPSSIESERIRQEKIDELNKAFLNSGLFDFDLFRRRHSDIEIEVR